MAKLPTKTQLFVHFFKAAALLDNDNKSEESPASYNPSEAAEAPETSGAVSAPPFLTAYFLLHSSSCKKAISIRFICKDT